MAFEFKESAYVYLISLDSQGNLAKLLPTEGAGAPVKIKANTKYSFPEKTGWLRLDNNSGQETFFLIASLEPIEDIDQRVDQLKKAGIDKITDIFSENKIESFKFRHE